MAEYNVFPGYLPDREHTVAAAIKAGIDSFTTDNTDPTGLDAAVNAALTDRLLTTADIDTAVSHTLTIRFRLGDFDPPGANPYASITPAAIDDAAHQAVSRQAADEAMVLLKNDGHALPLNPATTKKIAVIGPLENTLYSDWYSGNLPYQVTPLDGITQRLGSGATVSGTEAVDRIALQDVTTGKYVTAGSGTSGGVLGESDPSPAPTSEFDVFDWGAGISTLRSVANGKYLGYNFANFKTTRLSPTGGSSSSSSRLSSARTATTWSATPATRHSSPGSPRTTTSPSSPTAPLTWARPRQRRPPSSRSRCRAAASPTR